MGLSYKTFSESIIGEAKEGYISRPTYWRETPYCFDLIVEKGRESGYNGSFDAEVPVISINIEGDVDTYEVVRYYSPDGEADNGDYTEFVPLEQHISELTGFLEDRISVFSSIVDASKGLLFGSSENRQFILNTFIEDAYNDIDWWKLALENLKSINFEGLLNKKKEKK